MFWGIKKAQTAPFSSATGSGKPSKYENDRLRLLAQALSFGSHL
jgi:hypothetical protein